MFLIINSEKLRSLNAQVIANGENINSGWVEATPPPNLDRVDDLKINGCWLTEFSVNIGKRNFAELDSKTNNYR